jgi:hypothetical protein
MTKQKHNLKLPIEKKLHFQTLNFAVLPVANGRKYAVPALRKLAWQKPNAAVMYEAMLMSGRYYTWHGMAWHGVADVC